LLYIWRYTMVKGKVPIKVGAVSTSRKSTTTAVKSGTTTPVAAANQGPSKPSMRDVPSCSGCGCYITDEVKALQCDKCQSKEGWRCAECLNLPSTVYDTLVSESGPPLRWFCEECDDSWKKPGVQDIVNMMSRFFEKLQHIEGKLSEVGALGRRLEEVDEKLNLTSDAVSSKIEDLRSKVEGMTVTLQKTVTAHDKADESQLISKISMQEERAHKRLEEKVDDVMKAIGSQQLDAAKLLEGAMKTQNEEAHEEEEEKRKRKVNVIVHGLKEPGAINSEDRVIEDRDATEELLHIISCDTVSVRQVTRLGAQPTADSAAKPRPLRITFESEGSRDEVLRKAKNLRSKDGDWKRVFLHQDLTPRQREVRKKLVQELQERRSKGEADLVIVNGRITKRRV